MEAIYSICLLTFVWASGQRVAAQETPAWARGFEHQRQARCFCKQLKIQELGRQNRFEIVRGGWGTRLQTRWQPRFC